MVATTAGLPVEAAVAALDAPPDFGPSATLLTRTGTPSRTVTTASARSSTEWMRARPRMRYSSFGRSSKPPPAFGVRGGNRLGDLPSVSRTARVAADRQAPGTACVSPPMIVTCETPGTPSRRGRSTQSARDRSSIADVVCARQRDQHDLAHGGRDRAQHRRRDPGGEPDLPQLLGDELARAIDVGPQLELHVHDRDAGGGIRAHAEHPRRAVHRPIRSAGVTSASTSSGASPWASVRTVTVGAVRSGKTSTGAASGDEAAPDQQQRSPPRRRAGGSRATIG